MRFSFLPVKWGLTATLRECRRFHRVSRTFAWSTRLTLVPCPPPPVLEHVVWTKCRAAGTRRRGRSGAPHGRVTISTSRFPWVFQWRRTALGRTDPRAHGGQGVDESDPADGSGPALS